MQYLHTMLRVSDLDATLHFFCELLGMVKISQTDYPKGKFTLVFLAAADDVEMAKERRAPMLELTYNWEAEELPVGRGFGHLAYRVDNIYELCEKLQANGVVINRPPRDGHMAFVKSPDGISIELLQKGDDLPPTEPWLSMQNVGSW